MKLGREQLIRVRISVWRWVVEEGERASSPMKGMSPPTIPEGPPPIYGRDELAALLMATEGAGFELRRDHAVLGLLISTDVRLGEMAGVKLARSLVTSRLCS